MSDKPEDKKHYTLGEFSPEERKIADEFFKYKQEHPELMPYDELTPLQQRMQCGGSRELEGPVQWDSEKSLSVKIPEAAVITAFGGIMAISPEHFQNLLKEMANMFGVPCDEALSEYVLDVLRRQPQTDMD